VGEVAPTYFQKPEVRERIARVMPNCRIICSMRDPVERAYSLYRVFIREGETRLGFEEEVMRPESRILESNRYAFHLRGWRETFGTDNVTTFFYDDLEADEQAYVDSICDFLGVSRLELSEVRQFLVRNSVRRAPRNLRVADWAHNSGFGSNRSGSARQHVRPLGRVAAGPGEPKRLRPNLPGT
jgi:hypothetical protein